MTKNLDKLKIDIVNNFIKGDRPLSGVIMKQQWLKVILELSESKIVVGNAPIRMTIPCSSYTTTDRIQKPTPTSNTSKSMSDLKNTPLVRTFAKSKNSSHFKPQNMIQKPNYTATTHQHKELHKKPTQEQDTKHIERSAAHHLSHLESNTLEVGLYSFLNALDEAHLKLIQSLES